MQDKVHTATKTVEAFKNKIVLLWLFVQAAFVNCNLFLIAG